MSVRSLLKTTIVIATLCLASWPVPGTPNHMNLYALDARSKPEFRTSCGICHYAKGREDDTSFLTRFGKDFLTSGKTITPEIRDRYAELFIPKDVPVEDIPADTIRLTTEQVLLKVTVRNGKGKYVPGLGKGDFKLLEDDRAQEAQQFLGEDAPMAIAVLLDASGSAIEKDLERMRKAVLDLAYRLKPDDVLAIYTFGAGGVQLIRDYNNTLGDLKPLLKKLKGQGNTPLYDAVFDAIDELRDRPERRRSIILISDGADSASKVTQTLAERKAFLAGISIYAIDLINTQSEAKRSPERQAAAATLKQLAEETGGRYITTESGPWWLTSRGKLKRIFSDLIEELHKQYTFVYEPTNQRRAGRWRTIRVEMEDAEFTATTRLGYRENPQ